MLKKLAEALRFDLAVRRVCDLIKTCGRKGYGDISLLKSKVLALLYDAKGDRAIQRKLEDDKELRKIFKLPKAPVHSSFSKWVKRKGIEFFRDIMKQLVQIAMRIGLIKGSIVAVDSTGINAFVSKVKENYNTDPDAKWGYLKTDKHGNKILFYGYKIHLFVDCYSELPLAFAVLPANVSDCDGFWFGFNQLKQTIPLYVIRKLLADAGYDTSEIKQLCRDIGITPVIAINGRGHYDSETPNDKDYPKRWAIERNNSIMKGQYDLNNLKTKGVGKAIIHCLLCYNAMLATSIAKFLIGDKCFRSIN
jgi:transposase